MSQNQDSVHVADSPAGDDKGSESPVRKESSMAEVLVPRPSTCCVSVTVLCLLVLAGVAAYYSVWDDSKSFSHWIDRFFASERKIVDESKDGQTRLVEYDAGHWIYFIILCIIFLVNLVIIVPAMVVVLRRRCRSTTRKINSLVDLDTKPDVDVIVPCYLPNECEIIEETIWHILQKVRSPGALNVFLVYNTPTDMPELEMRLKDLSERSDLPHGRSLTVTRARESKSKAENLNLIIPNLKAAYTVIYDADHHPDPDSLMLLVEKIMRREVACIQGSTYIRDLNSGIVARIIDAEFFVTHFIYFPIMKLLTRNAVFCGSNGLWKTDALQKACFSPSMQTEDIDVSIKMLLDKHSIDFCPEARSGELAPVSLRALFKQRMRWAIGWDEVSLQLFRKMMVSDANNARKVAVSYLCWSRWCMQVVGLIAGIATPILGLLQRINPDYCHCGVATQLLQTGMLYFYLMLLTGCTLEAILQTHHRGCQSWIQVLFVAIFMGAGFFYVLFQALLIAVSLFRISTGTVGGWTVTARSVQKPKAQPQHSSTTHVAASSAPEPELSPEDELTEVATAV
jgi:cellulose synthase/poly-beta-1,6-N-acetylglucosamine synthase-like glycosyltransferase